MSSNRVVYVGVVADNVDPETRGRLKVRCAGLCGVDDSGEAQIYVAWVEPVFPFLCGDGNSVRSGMVAIPSIGTPVEIEVGDSSPTDRSHGETSILGAQPRWRGSILTSDGEIHSSLLKNYPNRRGWVTQAEHELIFDDTPGELSVLLVHADGSYISLDKDSSVVMATAGGDLLFMNNDTGEISLLNRHKSLISIGANGITMSGGGGEFISITPQGQITVTGAAVSIQASSLSLSTGQTFVGNGAIHPVVKGDVFNAAFITYLTAAAAAWAAVAPAQPAAAAAAAALIAALPGSLSVTVKAAP